MTKPKRYKIKATLYFKLSTQRLRAFLSRKYSVKHGVSNNTELLEKVKEVLPEQPYIAPVSARLLALGISDYRQWAIDEHNIIFYRVDDKSAEITLLLVIDARQDIQKLLYELILLK